MKHQIGMTFVLLSMACVDHVDVDRPQYPVEAHRLVTTEWLAENLGREGLIVIDARATPAYLAGHIPGALSASFSADEYISYDQNVSYGGGLDLFGDFYSDIPFQDGPVERVQEAARSLGIEDDSTVVIYDAGGTFHAARLHFTLHSHGLDDVRLLDGGMKKWEAEAREISDEVPSSTRGGFTAIEPHASSIATTDEVLVTLLDPEVHLLSGLLPSWHYGGYLAYSRAGHIPRTTHIPLGYFFKGDGTWREPETIQAYLDVMGVRPEHEVITYCGGNPLSACTYFTMKFVLGYPNVRNYTGSLVDWLNDPRGLPLDTYDFPEFLRDSDWIYWWAGVRMQYLLQDPPARVIDVRSSADFGAGHIPWAVNIAVPEDGNVLSRPISEWVELLGESGFDARMEAVVCDEQLTPRVAGLFWLLEALGHSEVSVCEEGLVGWRPKHQLTTTPAPRGEPKQALDIAIHPKTFEPRVDQRRILDNAEGARLDSRFGRVWVWAGEDTSDMDQDHKHVPATSHLTEDGRIKSAQEIWDIYEAAGVGKFAEVVIVGSTPGEAAINYLALRLIGFPMVRVFVPGGLN